MNYKQNNNIFAYFAIFLLSSCAGATYYGLEKLDKPISKSMIPTFVMPMNNPFGLLNARIRSPAPAMEQYGQFSKVTQYADSTDLTIHKHYLLQDSSWEIAIDVSAPNVSTPKQSVDLSYGNSMPTLID